MSSNVRERVAVVVTEIVGNLVIFECPVKLVLIDGAVGVTGDLDCRKEQVSKMVIEIMGGGGMN